MLRKGKVTVLGWRGCSRCWVGMSGAGPAGGSPRGAAERHGELGQLGAGSFCSVTKYVPQELCTTHRLPFSSPWSHQPPGLPVTATGHIHIPQLRDEGQRGHLSLGHKTDEDLPVLHQHDMAMGTISLATAFRHQAAKEISHQKAESFPGLTEPWQGEFVLLPG